MAWTREQQTAIDVRDKTLLVSAAAGSGKTATLTQRIIETVLDEKNPCDISSMLIVTFTKAAASELRERISAAISKGLEADPQNKHLARQALLVSLSHICTIDSFCNELVSANTSELDILPDYHICDGAEVNIMSHKVMEDLINDCFDGFREDVCTPREFSMLVNNLSTYTENSSLAEKLLFVYNKTGEGFGRQKYFENALSDIDGAMSLSEFFDTVWGKELKAQVKSFLLHGISRHERLLISLKENDPEIFAAYAGNLQSDTDELKKILASLDYGYEAAKSSLDCEFNRLKSFRGKDELGLKDTVKQVRQELKAEIKKIREKFFVYEQKDFSCLYGQMKEFTDVLARLIFAFEKDFFEEKKRRGAYEFGDITELVYKLLCSEDGSPTPKALEISESFKYVYIDEYQDVNEIQHKIFEAISKPENRFMVGDIKQSIYGFRGAEPSIFAGLKERYPDIADAEGSSFAKIFMSSNFRSDTAVIDFCNSVFDFAFSHAGESIGYEPGDRLINAKLGENQNKNKTEIHLFCRKSAEANDSSEDEKLFGEAEFVASEIADLLLNGTLSDGRRITPSDIAVISRKKSTIQRFADVLKKYGIEVAGEEKASFFDDPDVMLLISLLSLIDNPHRDAYTAGVMRSPLFGFSLDELVTIKGDGDLSLWDSLLEYNENHPDFNRGRAFAEKTNRLRSLARTLSADRLILEVFRETDILGISRNRQLLTAVYDAARKFEYSEFKGLYNFLNYIKCAEERNASVVPEVQASPDVGKINLLTVHHSKGLEYPICFVCGCGGRYKQQNDNLLVSKKYGISLCFRDESGSAVIDNPVRSIVKASIENEDALEEMRVLYVALTRARERLYITASPQKTASKLEVSAKISAELADGYSVAAIRRYIDLILAASIKNPQYSEIIFHDESEARGMSDGEDEKSAELRSASPIAEEKCNSGDEVIKMLEERFAYEYPHRHMTVVPSKLSVSDLHPRVLDGSDGEALAYEAEEAESELGVLPEFIGGYRHNAAERGTATHLFMQFCDFGRLDKIGAAEELKILVEKQFISETDASLVRLGEIERFRKSELFSALLSAKSIYRELRFNTRLPAVGFTGDEERRGELADEEILVQGVIDCIFEDSDGNIILVDYKTDRLTPLEKAKPELAEEMLRTRHGKQLSYYERITEKIFGRKISKKLIYSLDLGACINA